MQPINLDHNATAPILPAVAAAMEPFLTGPRGNPSSVHALGRRARAALEEARAAVAALLGGSPGEVIFTSGATEANNHALRGVVRRAGPGAHLVIGGVEHPSVAEAADDLRRLGHPVTVLPVASDGRVDPAAVASALGPRTALVSVQTANHETGVLQPLPEIAAVTRAAGVPLHSDAVQAVRRVPLDVRDLGVDLLTLSGHKIGGPPGVGALWVRGGVRIDPLLSGGGQEAGRRAGTENVPAAVGLGRAAELAADAPAVYAGRVAALRDRLEAGLRERWPGAVVHGGDAPRVGNTASIGFPGLDGETALIRFDLEGIAVSMGSACDAGAVRPSAVLRAMGVAEPLARASLRFSLGLESVSGEMDACLRVFAEHVAAGSGLGAGREVAGR